MGNGERGEVAIVNRGGRAGERRGSGSPSRWIGLRGCDCQSRWAGRREAGQR